MPGSLWFPFRQGTRSEYLALYILSALGVVVKVPKEEDIGADFHCSLAHIDGKRMTFHSPFLVQTKSIPAEQISYGGIDEKRSWKGEQIRWLFGQELPLLIGLVDKNSSNLKLYTTSNMWSALYRAGNPGEVVLRPDDPSEPENDVLPPEGEKVAEWPNGIGDGKRWKVPLGPPLISMSVDDSEDQERVDRSRKILSYTLHMEQENITYRRLNVHYSKWPLRIDSNNIENSSNYGVLAAANSTPGANTEAQLKALAPIVTTLLFNYRLQGRFPEIEHLEAILNLIPEGEEKHFLRVQFPELFHPYTR